jgi:NAD(P)-dependent dehydrogenase (short-subunit alcohol dehydrogenase family)
VSQTPQQGVDPRIDLTGKVAIVTGSSRGIGLAIAQVFAAAGASVMLTSRKQAALDEAAATVAGGEVATYAANAGESEQITGCVQATLERFGAVDILVNNAATNPHAGRLVDIDTSRFDKIIQVNLRGPLLWTQAVWNASMRERGGAIINVVSVAGVHYQSGIGAYSVSKAALIHMTEVLAADLGPGVRVNALAPGLVRTEFARSLWEPAEDIVAEHTPLGRIGEPDDIAGAALFLAGDLAQWMTGHTLVVDGGALARPLGA